MNPWKRRFLSKTIIFRFHVSFRGGILGQFKWHHPRNIHTFLEASAKIATHPSTISPVEHTPQKLTSQRKQNHEEDVSQSPNITKMVMFYCHLSFLEGITSKIPFFDTSPTLGVPTFENEGSDMAGSVPEPRNPRGRRRPVAAAADEPRTGCHQYSHQKKIQQPLLENWWTWPCAHDNDPLTNIHLILLWLVSSSHLPFPFLGYLAFERIYLGGYL